MRINIRLIALYAFSVAIMYLAGIYFGNYLHLFFLFFLIFPAFSFAALLVWYIGIDQAQTFSSLVPVKGQKLKYRLTLVNRGFLPIPCVRVKFQTVSASMQATLADFDATIPAQGSTERIFDVVCPYRGRYTVGVKELEVQDFLKFFTFRKRIDAQTFTVYPRILSIGSFAPVAADIEGTGRYTSSGILPDSTLFHELRQYRDGDSIRHIYWKKYASTGKPYLKEYERTRKSGVRIYFDLRKHAWRGVNPLEQEDASVEALVALVKYFLEHRIHTTLLASGRGPFVFSAHDMTSFEDFYRATDRLVFHDAPSPLGIYQSDRGTGHLESQTVIFITHIMDPKILSIGLSESALQNILVMNTASYLQRDREDIEGALEIARQRGSLVVQLTGGDTITRELEGSYASTG